MSLHTVGRNLAEGVTEGVEKVDLFSETTIGACVTCCVSLLMWLIFLPIFNLGAVPWMEQWEGSGMDTISDYMAHAEETYVTPKAAFYVLDSNADGNSTMKEFIAGSKRFKRPPFKFDEEAIPVFHDLDTNGDDSVSPQEFYAHVPARSDSRWHTSLEQVKNGARTKYGSLEGAYKAWDSNGDSKVTPDEFQAGSGAAVGYISPEDAQVAFNQADKNHDGVLDPREWVVHTAHCSFNLQTDLQTVPADNDANLVKAMEADLSEYLQTQPDDSTKCNVKANAASTARRRLESVKLISDCTIDVGSTERQHSIEGLCQQLPTAAFMKRLTTLLGAAPVNTAPAPAPVTAAPATAAPTTTQGHAGPAAGAAAGPPADAVEPKVEEGGQLSPESAAAALGVGQRPAVMEPSIGTAADAQDEQPHATAQVMPGPLNDEDLQQYYGRDCIIQGETEIYVTNFKCDDSDAAEKTDVVKTQLQELIAKVTGHEPEMQSADIANSYKFRNNVTISAKWEVDTAQGGKFQKMIQDQGWQLDDGTRELFKKVPMECMHDVHVRQVSMLTAQYYGVPAHLLRRGLSLQQEYGLKYTPDGLANVTGSWPYVQP